MSIEYLTYKQIDKVKWDNCIENAPNGLVYAHSLYLDIMAKNWDGLILNDYEAVMPLTWNKKYGIYYLYQPSFTACLGVFGNNISATLLNDFLKTVPVKFRYWDIYLNHGNYFSLPDFKLYERINYTLSLEEEYEILFSKFRNNTKRNIRKATGFSCIAKTNININDIITLSKEQSKNFSSAIIPDYDNFKKLYELLNKQGKAITYGVYDSNMNLAASSVFFFSNSRAYYIMAGNRPNGKAIGASHLLINTFIKDHAGKKLLLDFEGSDIYNLAFFYSSFGATKEKYAGIRFNELPKLLRLFKS